MSTERQTINIPSTKDQPTTEPYYVMDDRSKAALKDLQEGDLLQLVGQPVLKRTALTPVARQSIMRRRK